MKRFVDVIGAFSGLLVIAPLAPFIAVAIKFTSRGPILVKLKRVSAGKIIEVYKFRTMINNAHFAKISLQKLNERLNGPFFKIKNDPRLTVIGKFLRKIRLDEFPQMINVLKGELSIVGPRPHEPEEIDRYPQEYRHILSVKAGVTGLSQVNGASSLPFLKELELDNYYFNNQSLWLDIKIIAKTIFMSSHKD
jgi:lipopolysaccharide/colanic/teichoic acid biosynthesis glycosyltransferase